MWSDLNVFTDTKSEYDNYYLMLQEVPVMAFNLEEYYFKVYRAELLPFCLRSQIQNSDGATIKEIMKGIDLIRSFFSKRVLSLSRDNAKLLYGLFGISQANTVADRVEACLRCHAISVGDSYWVKRKSETLSWDKVNVRKNKLSSIIDVALDGQLPSLTTNPEHPDLTTDGLFRKSWVHKGDKLFLVKSDRTKEFVNTKMEILASEILDCLKNVSHVKYWGERRNENLFICVCENYCTEDLSTVHASEVMEYCKAASVDFKQWALNSFGWQFANIAVLDYVLLNTDRHTDNYGFYFENSSGEIVGLLPMYDHNLSLIADLDGTSERAAHSLSQMFNDRSTLQQLALEMKPYSHLIFDDVKFNQLRRKYPEYSRVFEGVLSRLTEV